MKTIFKSWLAVIVLLLSTSSLANHQETGRVFVFDNSRFMWFAYENGRLIKSGQASGGKSYCADVGRSCRTPKGVFSVKFKGGAGCRSSRYPKPNGGAWMGYCMFFNSHYAIHASHNVPRKNASHGCIRVKPEAAKWLNRHFLQVGDTVIVR